MTLQSAIFRKLSLSGRPIAGMLAVAMVAAAVTVVSIPASADCFQGQPVSAYVGDNSGNFAWEGPNYPSTCDGDGYYAGAIKDVKTDGYCVRVYFYDNDFKSYEGKSCNSSGAAFNYVDRSGNTTGRWCVGKGPFSYSNWCLESGINPFAWDWATGY